MTFVKTDYCKVNIDQSTHFITTQKPSDTTVV